ncbi:ABC transporter substrate-binding protein [Aurantiacibacter suaedae]|uniref:ABC transporter substrate-binding protein n=1 Tax=Aurantiacibacter suaedae TaxID=2545755 RepID=UPI0019D5109D|nr:ABC transporter substrate-binding protein [Aurantiacibacter suaedae]
MFVAEKLGLFEKHGLTIDLRRMGSLELATDAVRAGDADLTIGPPEGAIADYLAGGPLRLVAAQAVRLPMALVTRPEIMTIEDLKGKTIGTSSLREGTAIYTQIVLAQHGLHYPGDDEFAMSGIHTERWEALRKCEIDCAPQPAPWSFLAEDNGYNLIARGHDAIPEIVFTAVFGCEGWLAANRDTVLRFLRALAEAYDFANDPANEDFCVPVFQSITTKDDPDLAGRGFAYMRDLGMWPEGLKITPTALATTVDLMVQTGLAGATHRDQALQAFDKSYLADL